MIIGIDFDNTIVSYDSLFYETALERGVIKAHTPPNKKAVRDAIRTSYGDVEWQRLQGAVYGPGIGRAKPADGVLDFLRMSEELGCSCYIVSHKTLFSPHDETHTNLRTAALNWLQEKGFFKEVSLTIRHERVFFENTRQQKIAKIKSLICDVFIDDLQEILSDETLSTNLMKILYDPHEQHQKGDMHICSTWPEITAVVFDSVK